MQLIFKPYQMILILGLHVCMLDVGNLCLHDIRLHNQGSYSCSAIILIMLGASTIIREHLISECTMSLVLLHPFAESLSRH